MAGILSLISDRNVKELADNLKLSPNEAKDLNVDSPKLVKLLEQINDCISPPGASLPVEKNLNMVREKLQKVEVCYLQNYIIYSEAKKILQQTYNRGTSHVKNKLSNIQEVLKTTEVMSKLTRMQLPDSQCNDFDLKDRHFSSTRVKMDDAQFMQTILEDRLNDWLISLVKHYELISGCDNSAERKDHHGLSEALQLPSVISEKKCTVAKIKLQLVALTEDYHSQIRSYWQVLLTQAKTLAELAQQQITYTQDQDELKCCSVNLHALLLKLRVFMLEIEMKTYTADVVQTHQKISNHIQDALGSATSDKMVSKQQLSLHESMGSEFNALVSEYVSVTSAIKEKEWFLNHFKETNKCN